ncbi:hypothetical protein Agub_g9865, partial [Astrephomene gubernaculifera]
WGLAVMGFRPGHAWMQRVSSAVASMAGGGETAEADVALEPDNDDDAAPADAWWHQHLNAAANAVVAAAATATPAATALPGGTPNTPQLDVRQTCTCIWALARLGHRPAPADMQALLRHLCSPHLPPRQQPPSSASSASSYTSYHAAGNNATASAAAAAASGNDGGGGGTRLLAAATPQDLSVLLHALGVLRYLPEPQHVFLLVAATSARLHSASERDLVIWAVALSRLRIALPVPWFAAYLRAVAPRLHALPPLGLLHWLHAMTWLRSTQRLSASCFTASTSAPAMGLTGGQQGQQGHRQQSQQQGHEEQGAGAGCCRPAGHQRPQELPGARVGPWIVVSLPLRQHGSPGVQAVQEQGGGGEEGAVADHHASAAMPSGMRARTQAMDGTSFIDSSSSSSSLSSSPPCIPASPHLHRGPPVAAATWPQLASISGGCGVLLRPASRLLHPRLLCKIVRQMISVLPYLGLEQQCCLAWAVARLGRAVGNHWVVMLVRQTQAALEQRLRLGPRSGMLQQQQQQQQQPRGGAVGAVVEGRWLLKMVRALAETLRRHDQQHTRLRFLRANKTQQQPQLQQRSPQLSSLGPRHPHHRVHRSQRGPHQPANLVSRRWVELVLSALLPQLPSLGNKQLLRLLRALGRLRTRRQQGALGAELRAYCRARVGATCGGSGEEACDVTTA